MYLGAGVRDHTAGVLDESWSDSCLDGELLMCESDTDCQSIPTNGLPVQLQCVRNVCVLNMKSTNTCYSHADCTDNDQFCSGLVIFPNDCCFDVCPNDCCFA
jgi:hypothetical protein